MALLTILVYEIIIITGKWIKENISSKIVVTDLLKKNLTLFNSPIQQK